MFRKNDFEKLCDQLENCNEKCESNPIICARHYVSRYVAGNKDQLLKLKAEASSAEYISFVTLLFSMTSLLIAACSMILDISKNIVIIAYVLFAMIGCSVLMLNGMKKWRSVRKYQNYLLVVIDEELKKFD